MYMYKCILNVNVRICLKLGQLRNEVPLGDASHLNARKQCNAKCTHTHTHTLKCTQTYANGHRMHAIGVGENFLCFCLNFQDELFLYSYTPIGVHIIRSKGSVLWCRRTHISLLCLLFHKKHCIPCQSLTLVLELWQT